MEEFCIPKELQDSEEFHESGVDYTKPVGDYSIPDTYVPKKKGKRETGRGKFNKLKAMLYITTASVVSVAAVQNGEIVAAPEVDYVVDVTLNKDAVNDSTDIGKTGRDVSANLIKTEKDDKPDVSQNKVSSDNKSESVKKDSDLAKETAKPKEEVVEEIECPTCHGTGGSCEECGGRGWIYCTVCNNGIETCVVCHGSGWHVCYGCDGVGSTWCRSCNKTGISPVDGGTCPSCNGTGYEGPCNHCGGTGRETCEECGGKGSYLCMHCHGDPTSITHTCLTCGGNPATCPTCNGTGKIKKPEEKEGE